MSFVRHGLLSYKEWFTPPIKTVAGNGELLPNCESSRQRCPAVYSPVAEDDSPRVPEGCRFKRCEEIIKVKKPSAKIGFAFFHLSVPSAYAKKYNAGGKKINGAD